MTNQALIYKQAYRAIRAYQSGQSTVNPLTALRTMQECVPWSVEGETERTILWAAHSFNIRHQAPKGVHEALPRPMTKDKGWGMKCMYGVSVLRYHRPAYVRRCIEQLRLNAYARKALHIVTPFERLDIEAAKQRRLADLPLAA